MIVGKDQECPQVSIPMGTLDYEVIMFVCTGFYHVPLPGNNLHGAVNAQQVLAISLWAILMNHVIVLRVAFVSVLFTHTTHNDATTT